jgi:hypothetical protein
MTEAGICRFCGGDAREPPLLHQLHCDGRQGVNEARDHAMTQVLDHAERDAEGFTSSAESFVVQFLRHGPAPGEVITAACKRAGIVPPDDRAFGPVYMRLARRGWIVKAGAVRRERGHGTAGGNVWRLAYEVA